MKSRRQPRMPLLAGVALLVVACAPGDRVESPDALSTDDPSIAAREAVQPLIADERYVDAFGAAAKQLGHAVRSHGFDSAEAHAWLLQAGTVAHFAGEQTTAELLLDVALISAEQGERPSTEALAETLLRRGLVYRYEMKIDRAATFYDRARRLLEAEAPESPVLTALVQAEASRLRYRDIGRALTEYERVAALRSIEAQASLDRADTLTWTAWALTHYGRPDEGRDYRRRAFEELDELRIDSPTLLAALERLVAEERLADGAWHEAADRFERATEHYFDSHRRHFPGFGRRKSPVHGGMGLALAYLKLDEPVRAWNALQRAQATLTREAAALGAWRDSGRSEYAAWRASGRAYLDARRALRRLRATDERFRRTESVDALLALVDHRRTLLELEAAVDEGTEPPSLDEVREALQADEALFGFLHTGIGMHPDVAGVRREIGESWIYVVRPGRPLKWIPVATSETPVSHAGERALNRRVRDILFQAGVWPGQLEADPEFDLLLGEYGAIFEALHGELEGVERLVVDGYPLVPYEILRMADGRFWVDRYTIGYVPSVDAFVEGRRDRERRVRDMTRALVIADPIMPAERRGEVTAASFRSGTRSMVTEQRIDELRRLPFTAEEGERVASHFTDATLLMREAASETAIGHYLARSETSEIDVLHVATHGVGSSLPERLGFVVTAEGDDDGIIDAEDVRYGWPIRSTLVTLSGCRTIGLPGHYENLGLPQAFIAAGAENVVMSAWDIDDRATSLLMGRFYSELRKRPDSAAPVAIHEALREARRWLRDYREPNGERPYAHPAYWSGLISVGRL